MKITFVSGNISRSGGTERVLTLVANELSDRGYEVTVLSLWPGEKPYFKLNENIKLSIAFQNSVAKKLYKTWFVPRILLNNLFRSIRPDIVICVDTIMFPLIFQSLIYIHTKIVAWEHFNYFHTLQDVKRRKALGLAAMFADKIVLLTKADYSLHERRAMISRSKLEQIYNPAVTQNRSLATNDQNIVLAVGRLTPQKGFDRLLNIWKLVELEDNSWTLQIVGSGEDNAKLHLQANSLGLKHVEFISRTSKISEYYSNSSIYAMTSRYEGFPMVLLEASSAALPIVSFDIPTGPSEIIENEINGYLIPDNNDQKFSKRLLELMHSPKKRIEFGNASLVAVKRFETDQIVNKWEQLFRQLKP